MGVTFPCSHFHRSVQYWGENSDEFKFLRFNNNNNDEEDSANMKKVMMPFG